MGHTHRYQFCLKKKKSPSPESRVPKTGSDPPIGSGRGSGRDRSIEVLNRSAVELIRSTEVLIRSAGALIRTSTHSFFGPS